MFAFDLDVCLQAPGWHRCGSCWLAHLVRFWLAVVALFCYAANTRHRKKSSEANREASWWKPNFSSARGNLVGGSVFGHAARYRLRRPGFKHSSPTLLPARGPRVFAVTQNPTAWRQPTTTVTDEVHVQVCMYGCWRARASPFPRTRPSFLFIVSSDRFNRHGGCCRCGPAELTTELPIVPEASTRKC